MATTYYRGEVMDAEGRYTAYTFLNLVEKTAVESGMKFNIEAYLRESEFQGPKSVMKLFTKVDNKMSYNGKLFQCASAELCTWIEGYQALLESGANDICHLNFNFRFQDQPEDDLVLESIVRENCPTSPK